MALPKLSDAQRKAALEKAAKSRKERAELCAKLKKGEVSVGAVLSDTDNPIAMRMKVQRLIESLPGYGKARAAKLMEELNISPSRRVQGLGSRQSAELLERVEG